AVALVCVSVHDQSSFDFAFGVQRAQRDWQIRINAKAAPVRTISVMVAATEVDCQSVLQSQSAGEKTTAGCHAHRMQDPRVEHWMWHERSCGKFEYTGKDLTLGQRAQVLRCVNNEQLIAREFRGVNEPVSRPQTSIDQFRVDFPKLAPVERVQV